jgi:sterol desaturase/sphingolipid hydroxylase (fatty acid hydroxylase superfamily)
LTHGLLFAVPQVMFGFFVFRVGPVALGITAAVGVFVQYFIHSNLNVPLGPLEWIFVTPQNHRRHHALVEGVRHGNYGTTFSFWDRLFGTYVDWRDLPRNYKLGLGERDRTARMIVGI